MRGISLFGVLVLFMEVGDMAASFLGVTRILLKAYTHVVQKRLFLEAI